MSGGAHRGGDGEDLGAGRFGKGCPGLLKTGIVHRVGLGKNEDGGLLRKAVAVGFKLCPHRPKVGDHILRPRIDQVQKYGAALDMTQEPVADPRTLVCPLDQARNIGQHEGLARTEADHTELRHQGRERVAGDLGLGGAE